MRTFKLMGATLAVFLATFLAAGGCGSNKNSSGNGSTASTVGGTSVTGDLVKVDLTTNSTKINKGGAALVNVHITCSRISAVCPITDSNSVPVFSATPINSTDTSANSLTITATYSINAPATISPSSGTITLAAGTGAIAAAGNTPAVLAKLGATTPSVDFPVTVTGVSTGSAILTIQVYSTIASIVIDVAASVNSVLFQ